MQCQSYVGDGRLWGGPVQCTRTARVRGVLRFHTPGECGDATKDVIFAAPLCSGHVNYWRRRGVLVQTLELMEIVR